MANPSMDPCSSSFFGRDTLEVARALLGYRLVRESPDGHQGRMVGRIVETEAYTQNDPACHGAGLYDPETESVRSGRGADLFGAPGTGYVYLIYGMHWLLNVVTEPEGTCGAVLIRAIEPLHGLDQMRANRGKNHRKVDLTNGPGKLSEAFAIDDSFHRADLTQPPLYFAPAQLGLNETIATSSRIGISKATERHWRFYIEDHPYVSRATPSGQKE